MRNERGTFRPDGKEIRRLRKLLGLTQEDLAKKSAVKTRTIQRIEQGRPGKTSTLAAIAEALGVQTEAVVVTGSRLSEPRSNLEVSRHVIQFTNLIEDRTRGFTGRKFVFDAIDQFLHAHESGYFVIEGEPGIGKSAIMALLIKRRSYHVHHFNVRTQGVSTPHQFLRNVCARIITAFGLKYTDFPSDFDQDGDFLRRLLFEASEQLHEGVPLVVAIDALDEVDMTGSPIGSNILYLPETLPPGIFVVATTRSLKGLPFRSDIVEPFKLISKLPANREDVRHYLENQADGDALQKWMRKQKVSRRTFVDTMLDRSEANFMYLHYVLPEMEHGAYEDLGFSQIPAGLERYYDEHWSKMCMGGGTPNMDKITTVYVLSTARRPITCALLSRFAGQSARSTQQVLNEWAPFLRADPVGGELRYSFYHASFMDFLYRKDIVQATGIDLPEVKNRIADFLEKELGGTCLP